MTNANTTAAANATARPVAYAKPGATLLNADDHTLVMIDFQSQMAFATHSIDAITLRSNAGLVASAAAGFGVDTILTTVAEKSFSGPMFEEVTAPFPGQALLDRTSMNTWEDAAVIARSQSPSASHASCWQACGPACASWARPSPR